MDSSAHTPNTLRRGTSWRAALARRRRDARDMERRMRMMEVIGDISLAPLPLDELLQALLDGVRREMGLETVAILLPQDGGAVVTARVASGAGAEVAHTFQVPLGYGFVGEAMRSGKPVIIRDASEQLPHPEYLAPELLARMNLRSAILAPLVVGDRPIGALAVVSSATNHFTARDVRLVELVSARVALAIERARARDEAARAHERLRFLNDAGVALNATLDYRETTQRLADILTPTLGAACAVYLLEEDGLLRKAAVRAPAPSDDWRADALMRMMARLPLEMEARPGDPDCAVGDSIHALTPVFERVALVGGANDETVSVVSVPLVVRQHALGGFQLVGRHGWDFTAGDLPMLQGLAERAAVAIDNARLYLETQEALATGGAIATQLDTIFNATDVGIFVTDATGAYLRVNPYGAALLGLADGAAGARDEELRYDLRTPDGEPIPPEREPMRLARTQGRPVEQRVIIHRRDAGRDMEALIRCTPWRDTRNQIAGAVGVFTDITAISALERQKDEFIGIASHELKTPLTSLKILAQLLGRKLMASDDALAQEQAARMDVAITRMERLISDLLDVSLMQEGRLALTRRQIDLGALCADAVVEQRLLTQRTIHFHGPEDSPLLVYADAERIYQVVTNLLSNALKYSPAKEPVVVRAYSLGGECIVSVHDHGSGVPDDARDHIFDRFFRVPGMQVQSGSGVGLGLGLNISHEIISRHGGRIWVESKVGHGSVFSFALPRSDSANTP